MAQSSIEWTEMTWNPTTGCTKVSQGCKFCYAETMAKRLKAMKSLKIKQRLEDGEFMSPHDSLHLWTFWAIGRHIKNKLRDYILPIIV